MQRSHNRVVALWAVLFVSTAQAGQVDTVYISASRDVTLYEDSLGALANGSGQFFFTGRADSAAGGLIRRALVHFDIAGNVPSGAFVAEAAMTLNMSQTSSDSQLVGLHELESMWMEGPSDPPGGEGSGAPADTGDATWLHCRFPTDFWTTPGGVFDPIASDTEWVSAVGTYTWNSMYMAAEVQEWLDTPAINLGWAIVGNESVVKTAKRFDSRENPTPANRPVLMVVYATPTWTQVPANDDNTLYEDPTGSLSNGAGVHMFAGRTTDATQSIRRALVEFALDGYVAVDATIYDVRVKLHVSDSTPSTQVANLHASQASWNEGTSDATGTEEQGAPATQGDATWLRFLYDPLCVNCAWTTPGGDYAPVPLATTLVHAGGTYVWQSDSLTAYVQLGATLGASLGLIVLSDESQSGTLVRFDTKEHPDTLVRPVMEVAWSGGCPILKTGDVNVSGAITSADIIYLVNYVFKTGPLPLPCKAAGDINCSGSVTSADIIYLVMHVFKGGAQPCNACFSSPLAASCSAPR